MLSFAVIDIGLYLDAYPECQEAISYRMKLMEMYEETKDDGYRTVCDKAVSYAVETQMKSYN